MSELLPHGEPWRLLSDLQQRVAERAPAEAEILGELAARSRATEKRYQRLQKTLAARHAESRAAEDMAHASAHTVILQQYQADYDDVKRQWNAVCAEIASRYEVEHDQGKDALQEARWQAGTMFEAGKGTLGEQVKEIEIRQDAQWQVFDAIRQAAVRILRRRWLWHGIRASESRAESETAAESEPAAADAPPPAAPAAPAPRSFEQLLVLARAQLGAMAEQGIPRLFEGVRPLVALLLVWLATIVPWGRTFDWSGWYWIAFSVASAVLFCVLVGSWLFSIAGRQSARGYRALGQILAEAAAAREVAREIVKANAQRQIVAMAERRDRDVRKVVEESAKKMEACNLRRQNQLDEAEQKYAPQLAAITARRDRQLREAETAHAERRRKADGDFQALSARLVKKRSSRLARDQRRFQQRWDSMAGRWTEGIQRFQAGVEQLRQVCGQLFPDWSSFDWNHWTPPAQIPPSILFGHLELHLSRIEGGIPQDARLMPAQTDFTIPALFTFDDRSLLLLKAGIAGSGPAIAAVQALMLRLLVAIPPGKVRFMIIDPVGLGENFSAYMHLADYNEQLVSSRIWTDTAHIEQRLAELTGHMENVIQVYLRNEFASIEDYNRQAGALAEPYRILVVANFPVGFSETAAARLQSIVASGARCGVYTVMTVDPHLPVPRGFHLAEFERAAVQLTFSDGSVVLEHPQFGPLPLAPCRPPPAEQFTEIVRAVGRDAQDAARVEVPFAAIAPEPSAWWTGDSRHGIDVPLGRAGAMKFQHLLLGKGTSQHVLIAGKTGSGKSTLLHALITSLALRYSPDEIELYLVDFKKGVEFKAYAQAELPHARVIAIESEREFGLSVLERLDQELKRRGDLFRSQNAQDLAGFSAARPDLLLPRILLVIDEFQELFVEDDRTAQNASLLLDRLVRQGRAFGIHVLLGSQTLAGSYSLPRSTIGQMAVRIALQCSDADAHLILSEENTAARLLTRPGEAIYNDANGLFEGNHPFQVVWLPDHEREALLEQVQQFARQRNYPLRPPIVFEGNVAADLRKNVPLAALLDAAAWPEIGPPPQAWLGAAVAIKEPTSITLARHAGCHLLVVGHQEESALGILASCLLSLAAQHAPTEPNGGPPATLFYLLDGTRADSPAAGFWNRLVRAIPHEVRTTQGKTATALLAEIAEELACREAAGHEGRPSIYVFIYDVARFRELRRSDDDFGFPRPDEDQRASPAAQFARILREGPALGIHVLAWCDGYNTVNRTLDRQGLRELQLRVLFQMNATDSANLIDSPAASQLGVHRAILYDEGEGRLEKFRPYGPPADEWLAWIERRFQQRLPAPLPESPDSPSPSGRGPG